MQCTAATKVHAGAIGVESQNALAAIIRDPSKRNVARCKDSLYVHTNDVSTVNKHKDLMVLIFQKRPKGAPVPKARNRTFFGSIALTELGVPSEYAPWRADCLSAVSQEQNYVIHGLGTWLEDDVDSPLDKRKPTTLGQTMAKGLLAMYAEQVFRISARMCLGLLILP
jgi:hypothetical protein